MGRSELQKLLEQKETLKEQALARHWPGLTKTQRKTPLLIVFAPSGETGDGHSGKSHRGILFQLLESFLVLPGEVAIVSSEDIPTCPSSNGQKVIWLNPKTSPPQQLERWLGAADMALTFAEDQATLKKFFQKGVVPVAYSQSPLLENYHPNEETGNSFTFDVFNPWAIFMALVRAHETYRFPYDWQHIVRNMLKVR